ncbi:DNA polymerase III subunit epsilon [Brevundimonas sp. M20]|uniref:DNA polymerase III subunit epsilon n=1 Tax=Brevundimonas sp. M20 TaxID=2591463 RepID=UPI001146790A|nr:DNA polymerase III subunit epsilon [Brevundimonas sp. M20]QDH71985.1 DNA polymerase III subunit epsilon [Brevundimonas sp. M20]
MREIVLDTETTGFDPKTGDRLIEVGCIELMDLLPTGRTYHTLVNPDRLIPPDATRVHGITDDKVKDAPRFADIVKELDAFIGDAPVIAHNAQFDRNFIDFEYARIAHPLIDGSRWIDTLQLAQKKFPGMPNSLDALCKRFKVSLADRTFHGALIDARLLAEVYLELRGGKERRLDLSSARVTAVSGPVTAAAHGARPRPLAARSTEAERAAHLEFLKATLKDHTLWEGYGLDMEKAPAA